MELGTVADILQALAILTTALGLYLHTRKPRH